MMPRTGECRLRARGRRRSTELARVKSIYTCTECGGTAPKWQGQCPSCGAWNTLVESVVRRLDASLQERGERFQTTEAVRGERARGAAPAHRRGRVRSRTGGWIG